MNNRIEELEVIEVEKRGYGFEKEKPLMIVGTNNVLKLVSNLRIDRKNIIMSFPQIKSINSIEVDGIFGLVDEVEVDFIVRNEKNEEIIERYHIYICGYKPAENKEDMLMKMINLDMQEFEIPEGFSYFRPDPKAFRNFDEE